MKNYPHVDAFLAAAKRWRTEMKALRQILVGCQLEETIKWGKPCYTFQDNNIALIQPFKNTCALMFFKGVLLKDEENLLEAPGENSHAARRFVFSSLGEVEDQRATIEAYVYEAIAIEEAGLSVPERERVETYTPELEERLRTDTNFERAFSQLTPGRQRAYNLYFSEAKQSKTRVARIEKYYDWILAGKGMHDR